MPGGNRHLLYAFLPGCIKEVFMSNHSSISRFRPGFIPFLFLLLSLIFLICIGPGSTQGFAAQVTLAWDANTDPGVAGYKLYYGKTSRTYGTPVDVGKVTVFTLTGIEEGKNGYFAVTAYDANRNESAFSTELECFTLVPSQSANGSISPSGPVVVSRGMNQTFTVTPAANYKVSDVTVDGHLSERSQLHFFQCRPNHNIAASFAAVSNLKQSAHLREQTDRSVPREAFRWLTAAARLLPSLQTPAIRYRMLRLTGHRRSGNLIHFSNVTATRSIAASFIAKTYAIAHLQELTGRSALRATFLYTHGGSQAFTITANTGYQVQDVKVDGTSVGAVTTYTFSNVTPIATLQPAFLPSEHLHYQRIGGN